MCRFVFVGAGQQNTHDMVTETSRTCIRVLCTKNGQNTCSLQRLQRTVNFATAYKCKRECTCVCVCECVLLHVAPCMSQEKEHDGSQSGPDIPSSVTVCAVQCCGDVQRDSGARDLHPLEVRPCHLGVIPLRLLTQRCMQGSPVRAHVCVCVCVSGCISLSTFPPPLSLSLSLSLPPSLPLPLSVTNDEEGMHTGKDVCPACRPSEERR